MAYTKTNWNESTPITVDTMNKIETGIANGIDKTEQIMEIPITNSSGWQQFRWTRPETNTVSWTRDANQRKALEIFNETYGKQLLLLGDDGGLDVQKYLTVNGGDNTEHADIFLKYDGKFRGLLRGLSWGGLQLHSYNEDGTWANEIDMVAGLITLGSSAKVNGNLTTAGNLKPEGKLAFSNVGTGGGLNANIHNLALHANTGNGQMLTADVNRIYVGNPNTNLTIESSSNPVVKVSQNTYQLYHTGNKPTAGEIGALPLSGGTLTGNLIVPGESRFNNGTYIDPWHGTTCAIKASGNVAVQGKMKLDNSSEAVFHESCGARNVGMYLNANNWGIYDYQNDRTILRYNMDGNRVEIQGRRAATWEGSNPTHHMFRYGSGLGGASGYITFSY